MTDKLTPYEILINRIADTLAAHHYEPVEPNDPRDDLFIVKLSDTEHAYIRFKLITVPA